MDRPGSFGLYHLQRTWAGLIGHEAPSPADDDDVTVEILNDILGLNPLALEVAGFVSACQIPTAPIIERINQGLGRRDLVSTVLTKSV
jgi:hypothetical protein